VADEAVSALDVSVQAHILALLAELREEMNLAMLFITHDLRVAAEIADRIVVMRYGEIVEQGETQSVFRSPRHAYTARCSTPSRPPLVRRSRRRRFGQRHDRLVQGAYPIPGCPEIDDIVVAQMLVGRSWHAQSRRDVLPTIASPAAQTLGAHFPRGLKLFVVAPLWGQKESQIMRRKLKKKYWTMLVAAGAAISCGAVAYATGFTLPAAPKIAFLTSTKRTTAAGPRLSMKRARKSRSRSA